MLESLAYVLCAFLFFVLLLPLAGMIIGAVLYVGLPYLAGIAVACVAHKLFHGSFFDLGAFWLLALLWAVVVVHMRQIYQKMLELEHAWHEGHYLAATTIVMMGQPYRKKKKAMAS